jgi:hypothetical protein
MTIVKRTEYLEHKFIQLYKASKYKIFHVVHVVSSQRIGTQPSLSPSSSETPRRCRLLHVSRCRPAPTAPVGNIIWWQRAQRKWRIGVWRRSGVRLSLCLPSYCLTRLRILRHSLALCVLQPLLLLIILQKGLYIHTRIRGL